MQKSINNRPKGCEKHKLRGRKPQSNSDVGSRINKDMNGGEGGGDEGEAMENDNMMQGTPYTHGGEQQAF